MKIINSYIFCGIFAGCILIICAYTLSLFEYFRYIKPNLSISYQVVFLSILIGLLIGLVQYYLLNANLVSSVIRLLLSLLIGFIVYYLFYIYNKLDYRNDLYLLIAFIGAFNGFIIFI